MELINYKTLEEVAAKIKNARTCHFIGVGESLYFCEMMVDNLRCYDYRAEYYQTYREIEYRIKHCEEKDILFVISASGENGRLNNWVEEAKQNGIFVISVTHFNENRLAGLAHIPLYYWGDEQKLNGYNVADRTGMMMLLRELTEVFWRMYCV
jgi:DNA-binding MurR/RpiR family transcriptional regulator